MEATKKLRQGGGLRAEGAALPVNRTDREAALPDPSLLRRFG